MSFKIQNFWFLKIGLEFVIIVNVINFGWREYTWTCPSLLSPADKTYRDNRKDLDITYQKFFGTLKWYRPSILLKSTWINLTTLLQYGSELHIHELKERDNMAYQCTFISKIAQYEDFPETLVALSFNGNSVNSFSINVMQEYLQIAVVKRVDAGRHNCSLHHLWRAISVVISTSAEVLTEAAGGEKQ